MPIVLREKGYRFGFYAGDRGEPAHIHVEKGGAKAKYWLDPIALATTRGFRPHELNEIEKITASHGELLLEAWRAFFNA